MTGTEHSTATGVCHRPRAVTESGALLGESPVWNEDVGRLLWVDIWAGTLHATDPVRQVTSTTEIGPPVSAVLVSARGTPVLTAGLCVLELTDEGARHIADVPEPACMRVNDAAVDPAGRLWLGTMTLPCRPARSGALWRLDQQTGAAHRVVDDVLLANGIAWSPSGERLYFVDSLRQQITAFPFDVESGSIGTGVPFVHIPAEDGMPDGLTVDSEGGVWVAMAGGGAVRRYHPSGSPAEHVVLPTPFPTSCTFGGVGLRELFVTSGSRPIVPERRAQEIALGAGAVHSFECDVPGLASARLDLLS